MAFSAVLFISLSSSSSRSISFPRSLHSFNNHFSIGRINTIAKLTGISPNTLKNYCKTRNIPVKTVEADSFCGNCGKPISFYGTRQNKRFCCDRCRNQWWNAHQDMVRRDAWYETVCLHCGKTFRSYGNRNRKYCCRKCYTDSRRKRADA